MTTTEILITPSDNPQSPQHAPEPCSLSDEVPSSIAPTPTPRTARPKLVIDRALLETLLAHAMSAARLVGSIDDGGGSALPEGLLANDIDAIAHELSEVLGNPHLIAAPVPSARSAFAPDVVSRDDVVTGRWDGARSRHRGGPVTHQVDINIKSDVDVLRQCIARVEALATAVGDTLDEARTEGTDRRRLERLAHLSGATIEAARAAVEAGDELAVKLSTHRTGA